ncbi:MAG: nuclear transport factor 2 family protein [Sporichthyaceae bacterium]|jgi:ketosteroid isomerase-like protein
MLEEEPDLVALLDAWSEAIVSNDADAIGSYMAEEWVIVSETGVSSREDFLALVRSGRLTHSAMRRIGDARVRIYGDTATITARVANTAHYEGEQFEADEWTTDVLVQRGDRWLCVLSQISSAVPAE